MRDDNRIRLVRCWAVVFLFLALPVVAIPSIDNFSDKPEGVNELDAALRSKIIETVISELHGYYNLPDVAALLEQMLRRNLTEGKYDRLTTLGPFIMRLTDDLRNISNDKHMGVWPYELANEDQGLDDEQAQELLSTQKFDNFGFRQLKHLPGNIGYLELSEFADSAVAGATAVAAMNFLANSDALIIDLRKNGGGDGTMVNLIGSYFFADPKLSITVYSRFDGQTIQGWTRSFVPGPRMTEIPVYVLISERTASAAEHLTYFLQAEKRATIVGSTSRGAANPCVYRNYPDLSISIQIPAFRATNPITGGDWEGTGIKPDIAVSAQLALLVACKEAAAKLLENEIRDEWKQKRREILSNYEVQLYPLQIDSGIFDEICGQYKRSYTVYNVEGKLHLVQGNKTPEALIPFGDHVFAFEKRGGRVRFEIDSEGRANAFILTGSDGFEIRVAKING